MKNLLPLFTFLLLSADLFAGMVYTSLRDGNWNDNTVWSTDGTNPCFCSPSASMSGTNVIINHKVNATANITVAGGGHLEIGATGELYAPLYTLFIDKGTYASEGDASIKKLDVTKFGSFYMHNGALSVTTQINVYGAFLASFANIYIQGGNIEVFSTGHFEIIQGTKLYFISGNYNNYGTTSICATCCLHLSAGNVNNDVAGNFEGDGMVITELGNIKNFNFWQASLRWCANGTTVGLNPLDEDCLTTMIDCVFVPLPTNITEFKAVQHEKEIETTWHVANEVEVDHYQVETSNNGYDWEFVAKVFSNPMNDENVNYNQVDKEFSGDIIYYRLTQYDVNGQLKDQKITYIKPQYSNSSVYPNPFDHSFEVLFEQTSDVLAIEVFDVNGRKFNEYSIEEGQHRLVINDIQTPGVYFLTISKEEGVESFRMVKR